jgi:hypothetical protein
LLWHLRVPFAGVGNAGNLTGRRNGSNHPPCSKGSKAKVVRLAKPDTKLSSLEATAMAEELKARIRAAKMMSQGISYSQVVQAHAPVHVVPAPTSALAQARAPAPTPRSRQASSRLLSLQTKRSGYCWKLSSSFNSRVQKHHQNTSTTYVEARRTGKNFTREDMECRGDSVQRKGTGFAQSPQ